MATIDFYAILELPNTATDEDVRKAYRRLAIRWHPDKNPHDVGTAERRFKEVAEAYEVLRDPFKRRQYDRARTGRTRPRRATSWFGNTDGFGDDLWSDDGWGGSGPGWAFRNPFDVFKEFFGERDPWADMTPRSKREGARSGTGSSFWSMSSEPFFSRPFSSPFFTASRSSGSLFDLLDQRRAGRATPTPTSLPAQPERVEIKIRGFSDSEDSSSSDEDEDDEGEVVIEQVVIDDDETENEVEEGEEVETEEDVALKEAIRLSLEQERERKRNQQRVVEQTEEDVEEAIRRSLADVEQQQQQRPQQRQAAPTGGDWMDVEELGHEPPRQTRERGIPLQASDRHYAPVLH